MIQKLVF